MMSPLIRKLFKLKHCCFIADSCMPIFHNLFTCSFFVLFFHSFFAIQLEKKFHVRWFKNFMCDVSSALIGVLFSVVSTKNFALETREMLCLALKEVYRFCIRRNRLNKFFLKLDDVSNLQEKFLDCRNSTFKIQDTIKWKYVDSARALWRVGIDNFHWDSYEALSILLHGFASFALFVVLETEQWTYRDGNFFLTRSGISSLRSPNHRYWAWTHVDSADIPTRGGRKSHVASGGRMSGSAISISVQLTSISSIVMQFVVLDVIDHRGREAVTETPSSCHRSSCRADKTPQWQ